MAPEVHNKLPTTHMKLLYTESEWILNINQSEYCQFRLAVAHHGLQAQKGLSQCLVLLAGGPGDWTWALLYAKHCHWAMAPPKEPRQRVETQEYKPTMNTKPESSYTVSDSISTTQSLKQLFFHTAFLVCDVSPPVFLSLESALWRYPLSNGQMILNGIFFSFSS